MRPQWPPAFPRAVRDLTLRFHYNDLASVRELFDAPRRSGGLRCARAATYLEPAQGFLAALRDLCHERGALLVFDEMITGFRWHLRGAQEEYDVDA